MKKITLFLIVWFCFLFSFFSDFSSAWLFPMAKPVTPTIYQDPWFFPSYYWNGYTKGQWVDDQYANAIWSWINSYTSAYKYYSMYGWPYDYQLFRWNSSYWLLFDDNWNAKAVDFDWVTHDINLVTWSHNRIDINAFWFYQFDYTDYIGNPNWRGNKYNVANITDQWVDWLYYHGIWFISNDQYWWTYIGYVDRYTNILYKFRGYASAPFNLRSTFYDVKSKLLSGSWDEAYNVSFVMYESYNNAQITSSWLAPNWQQSLSVDYISTSDNTTPPILPSLTPPPSTGNNNTWYNKLGCTAIDIQLAKDNQLIIDSRYKCEYNLMRVYWSWYNVISTWYSLLIDAIYSSGSFQQSAWSDALNYNLDNTYAVEDNRLATCDRYFTRIQNYVNNYWFDNVRDTMTRYYNNSQYHVPSCTDNDNYIDYQDINITSYQLPPFNSWEVYEISDVATWIVTWFKISDLVDVWTWNARNCVKDFYNGDLEWAVSINSITKCIVTSYYPTIDNPKNPFYSFLKKDPLSCSVPENKLWLFLFTMFCLYFMYATIMKPIVLQLKNN